MTADLVLARGTVVRPDAAGPADLLVKDGRILDVVEPGVGRGAEVIDAAGRVVLPGGVDAHVHFLIGFMGQRSVYDFWSGTAAALRGGNTTVIDFALQRRGRSLMDGLRHRRVQADRHVACDYGLHLIATDVNAATLAEVPAAVAAGASSFKVYTVYEKEQLKVEDGPLHDLMRALGRAGGMVGLHAENASLIDHAIARHLAAGEVAPRFHALSRPALAETEAVSRGLLLAADAGCPLHIFHLNSAPALALVEAAQARGQPASAETCTHYLALTAEVMDRADGHLFVMSPPLRDAVTRDAMWAGVAGGSLAAVTSDDASYSAEAKALGAESFDRIANGVPGVEHRLPLLWTLGVQAGRLTLPQLAEAWSTGPARLFGLAPAKGAIAPGADADLVVLDPALTRRMTAGCHHGPIGYTPFEGMELSGWPVLTLRRGTIAARDGVVHAKPGEGRFLARRGPGG
ncbi:dihydropyrimidinase [Falsiroseomonas sp. CW058]|uniref:dihydropyrimidinase n=1 Tax=Falsiroseomonas sp. CW058 TaxID=3388664 RepID=UPI003D311A9E